jgi:hypothetical protein
MKKFGYVALGIVGTVFLFIVFVLGANGLFNGNFEGGGDLVRFGKAGQICPSTAKSYERLLGKPAPWTLDPPGWPSYTGLAIRVDGKIVEGGQLSGGGNNYFFAMRSREPCFDLELLTVSELSEGVRLSNPIAAKALLNPNYDVRYLTDEEQAEADKMFRMTGTIPFWTDPPR